MLEELALIILFINIVADYISLQETRWVMRASKDCGIVGLIGWVVFDIVATGFIFLFIAHLYVYAKYGDIDIEYSVFFRKEDLLVLFLSTFFTSALWFAFIVSILSVRALSRFSRSFHIVLNIVAAANAPARTAAGFLCVALVAVYMVVYGISAIFS